jgi:hypothetical protein
MRTDFDSVLEDCLQHLAQGETPQACLSYYPEHAAELKPLLAVAARLKSGAQVRPSPAFKSRARAQLRAHMDAHPHKPGLFLPRLSTPFRLAFSIAALALAFSITTGMALAQFALPGDVLYPWKLSSEAAWRTISPDPIGVDLDLGNRRIDEALAVSDNAAAQGVALHGYENIVANLAHNNDSAAQERIQKGLKTQQERLKNAGLKIPEHEGSSISLP